MVCNFSNTGRDGEFTLGFNTPTLNVILTGRCEYKFPASFSVYALTDTLQSNFVYDGKTKGYVRQLKSLTNNLIMVQVVKTLENELSNTI